MHIVSFEEKNNSENTPCKHPSPSKPHKHNFHGAIGTLNSPHIPEKITKPVSIHVPTDTPEPPYSSGKHTPRPDHLRGWGRRTHHLWNTRTHSDAHEKPVPPRLRPPLETHTPSWRAPSATAAKSLLEKRSRNTVGENEFLKHMWVVDVWMW